MKVPTRLAVHSGLSLLFLVAVVAYQLFLISRLTGTVHRLAGANLVAAELVLQQIRGLDEAERLLRKYLLTKDPDYADRAVALSRDLARRQGQLVALDLAEPERKAIASAQAIWERSTLSKAALEGRTALPAELSAEPALLGELGRLREAGHEEGEAIRQAISEKSREAESAAMKAQRASAVGFVLALGVALTVLAFNVRAIQGPLQSLARATHEVSQGRFALKITPTGGEEFKRLAEDFNAMVARLSELDRMKRDLLSNVSHDLKGPLASIRESIGVLLDEVPGPLTPAQRRLLELNSRSAARLSAMIVKLLDMTRLESGAIVPSLAVRDLAALARSTLDELGIQAADRRLSLVLRTCSERVEALVDGELVTQVLQNLVENAMRFAPEGTTVEVRLESEGDGVLLSVSDGGPGIPEGEREAIFERFHQCAGGLRPGGDGLGLGLAICREIVSLHKGRIWVENREQGGSVFTVSLPAMGGERGREER